MLHRPRGQSIGDVCRVTGISEKTGHKWLQRYGAGGPEALADRSHAPHQPAHQVPRPVAEAICQLREAHPTRGEYVGLQETAEGEWTITFGPLTLGTYSRSLMAFTEHLAWTPPSE